MDTCVQSYLVYRRLSSKHLIQLAKRDLDTYNQFKHNGSRWWSRRVNYAYIDEIESRADTSSFKWYCNLAKGVFKRHLAGCVIRPDILWMAVTQHDLLFVQWYLVERLNTYMSKPEIPLLDLSILNFAIVNDCLSVVRYVVETFKLTAEEVLGSNGFFSAIESNHVSIFRYLVEKLEITNNDEALINKLIDIASVTGSLSVVRYLVEHVGLINIGTSIYNKSTYFGHLSVLRYLVEKIGVPCGLDLINAHELAVCNGYFSVVRYLVERVQIPVDKDKYKIFKALKDAVSNDHVSIFRYLFKRFKLTVQDLHVYGLYDLIVNKVKRKVNLYPIDREWNSIFSLA